MSAATILLSAQSGWKEKGDERGLHYQVHAVEHGVTPEVLSQEQRKPVPLDVFLADLDRPSSRLRGALDNALRIAQAGLGLGGGEGLVSQGPGLGDNSTEPTAPRIWNVSSVCR